MQAIDVRKTLLDVICQKAPWSVTMRWPTSTQDEPVKITGDQLRAFYAAVPEGAAAMAAVVGTDSLSDRRCDRMLQILKRANLIQFNKTSRAWETV